MAHSYQYVAKDLMGNDVQGILEGPNEQDITRQLREKDLFVISITSKDKKKRNPGKVKAEDLVAFARQLATMVEAGLPILECLQILQTQTDNPSFKKILGEVITHVEEGGNLVEALGQYPNVFGNLFIQMVGSGEAIGKLAEILTKLAEYLEAANALKKKVKSAMTYPIVVTCICMVITTFMIVQVIPVFATMYEDFDAALPAPTQFLIDTSHWVRGNLLYLIVLFIAAFYLLKFWIRTEGGRWAFDRLSLRLPVFGPLIRKIILSRFSNTLSVLLGSGLPILQALEIVKGVVNNKVYATAMQRTMDAVMGGENIAESMKAEACFPSMIVKMVDVGEKTGKLESMLNKISQYYDEQVSATVSALTSLIEPFLIVFLGVVIGGIVLSMFLPIFNLVSAIH